MPLNKALKRIMDLDKPLEEAKKKLQETWMLVNGSPFYVMTLIPELNLITGYSPGEKGPRNVEVTSLDVWLPESGLYPMSNGYACLVIKYPKRQWQKSFRDTFYKVKPIGKTDLTKTYLADIAKGKRSDIFIDPSKRIWFWENEIGYFNKKEGIVCTDLNFKQELLDWSKNEDVPLA